MRDYPARTGLAPRVFEVAAPDGARVSPGGMTARDDPAPGRPPTTRSPPSTPSPTAGTTR